MNDALQGLIDMAFGTNVIEKLNRVLNIDINNVLTYIKNISDVSIPIAAVILCMYLVMEVMEKVTDGNFTTEQFLKILIKLAFGQFLITNATAFVLQFMNVGVAFMNSVTTEALSVPMVVATIDEDMGFLETIGMLLLMLLPAVVGFFLSLAVQIMGYVRNLEMIIRAMFAPIGVADVMHGGANSHGMRYLKDCLAIALQGAIMIGVVIAASAIMSSVLQAGGGFSWDLIITYFGVMGGMVGLLGQSKSIAKDIVG